MYKLKKSIKHNPDRGWNYVSYTATINGKPHAYNVVLIDGINDASEDDSAITAFKVEMWKQLKVNVNKQDVIIIRH